MVFLFYDGFSEETMDLCYKYLGIFESTDIEYNMTWQSAPFVYFMKKHAVKNEKRHILVQFIPVGSEDVEMEPTHVWENDKLVPIKIHPNFQY